MNNFLPENYKDPVIPGNYMRLEEGDNTFRVLSSAITGWIIWGDEVKEGKQFKEFIASTDQLWGGIGVIFV